MKHIFIVNPFAGKKRFSSQLREQLKEIKGLDYYVFNTRSAGKEAEVIQEICDIFMDEPLRIYCCGGSGTMRNMLDGFDDLSKVEVAFYPCGLSNDFLKVFGRNERRFLDIEELIYGDVISVDYIRTNHGIALNTVSVGVDSRIVEKLEYFRNTKIFGRQLPYTLAQIDGALLSRPMEYEICLDEEQIEGKFTEIFFGNGGIIGRNLHIAQNPCVTDGFANVVLVPALRPLQTAAIQSMLRSKYAAEMETIFSRANVKKMKLRLKNGKPFGMNLDGELIRDVTEWEMEIVPKGLRFVVPKGVVI